MDAETFRILALLAVAWGMFLGALIIDAVHEVANAIADHADAVSGSSPAAGDGITAPPSSLPVAGVVATGGVQ